MPVRVDDGPISMNRSELVVLEEEVLGLAGEHDYAVLDISEESGNRRLLVKNPWCDGLVWKGVGALGEASALDQHYDDNNDNDDVPTTDPAHPHSDLHFPPSIRVISVEAERESQKVRSLYETTGGLNWEDGKRPASHDGRLESQVDVPSNGDENDAYGFLEHNPPFIYLLPSLY